MKAGMELRAGPAYELPEIGIDDGAETPMVARSLLHAAGRIVKKVAVIGEGELDARAGRSR